MRPTFGIEYLGTGLSVAAAQVGSYLAWLSDIVGLFIDIWEKIKSFFGPYLTKIFSAMTDIIVGFCRYFITKPLNAFTTAYNIQLDDAYNIFATVFVSFLWVGGLAIIPALVLEIVGITKNKDAIRPSIYIRSLAQYIYNEFFLLGYIYLKAFDFFGVIVKMLKRLFIDLQPYIERINEALYHIFKAYGKLLKSPTKGFVGGLYNAVATVPAFLRGLTFTASVSALVVIGGAVALYIIPSNFGIFVFTPLTGVSTTLHWVLFEMFSPVITIPLLIFGLPLLVLTCMVPNQRY
jgi:hypothetical protein